MRIQRYLFFSTAIITLIIIAYYSPLGVYFNRTYKTYFYDDKREHCLTVIFHAGTFNKLLASVFFDFKGDIEEGIYLTPGRFYGILPDKNYIRLNYIGNENPIYYKWQNDTLTLRIPFWKIIENELPSTVILDTIPLDYERWGIYDADKTHNVKERQEWQQMKMTYRSFNVFELK